MHLEQFDGRHLGHQQSPRVALPQVDLLQVLIQPSDREEVVFTGMVFGQERHLRELSRMRQPRCGGDLPVAQCHRLGALGKNVVATQSFVRPQQMPHGFGHPAEARRLAIHHMPIELGRTPDGLAGVVDDEVEPIVPAQQVAAELLDTRGVPQVQPVDL